MLRMLIVEDERLEREGLLTFLDWRNLGIDIVGSAADGIEGIEKADSMRPDIIITDIKMPGMDGLAMSKKIKEFLPGVKIIILTGYDDFKMAKEAISFNVNAYILKPLEDEEAIPVLKKTIAECLREKERLETEKSVKALLDKSLVIARKNFLLDILEGKTEWCRNVGQFEEYGIREVSGSSFTIVIIKLEYGENIMHEGCADLRDLWFKRDIDIVRAVTDSFAVFSLDDLSASQSVLCLKNDCGSESLISLIKEMYRSLGPDQDTRVVVGVGCPVSSMDDIRISYSQAMQSVEFGAFWSVCDIVRYDMIESLRSEFAENAGEFLISNNYFSKQLVHSVRLCDETRMSELLSQMFQHIDSNRGASRELIVNCLQNLINEASIVLYSANRDKERHGSGRDDSEMQLGGLKDLQSMEDCVTGFFKDVFDYISGKKSNKDGEIVKKVIGLIEKRYMTDISLKLIAGEVYLSPNYLGTVFRKYTGSAFNDYLCGYRMEKARELLASPKNKVSWVAGKVGIPNTSYFCTIFKSRYGTAPGEFQEIFMK